MMPDGTVKIDTVDRYAAVMAGVSPGCQYLSKPSSETLDRMERDGPPAWVDAVPYGPKRFVYALETAVDPDWVTVVGVSLSPSEFFEPSGGEESVARPSARTARRMAGDTTELALHAAQTAGVAAEAARDLVAAVGWSVWARAATAVSQAQRYRR